MKKAIKTMDDYLEKHKKCGIKVGDRVKVTRIALTDEAGWENGWIEDMDNAVGKTGKAVRDNSENGFELKFPREKYANFSYPYFVLKKMERKEEKARVKKVGKRS